MVTRTFLTSNWLTLSDVVALMLPAIEAFMMFYAFKDRDDALTRVRKMGNEALSKARWM